MNHRDKLEKIKRLMDGTSGAEHDQIRSMYERLEKKYGQSDHAAWGHNKEKVRFAADGYLEHSIYVLAILSVTGSAIYDDVFEEGHKFIEILATRSEAAQIEAVYESYCPLMKEEAWPLLAAFAVKHGFIPEDFVLNPSVPPTDESVIRKSMQFADYVKY